MQGKLIIMDNNAKTVQKSVVNMKSDIASLNKSIQQLDTKTNANKNQLSEFVNKLNDLVTRVSTLGQIDNNTIIHALHGIKKRSCRRYQITAFCSCAAGNIHQNFSRWGSLLKHAVSGKCLDGNGESLYYGPCQTGNPHQRFDQE